MTIELNQFRPSKTRISRNITYGLTQLGKVEVDENSFEGGALWELLGYLDENGPSKMSQIAKEMKQDESKIKYLLKKAIRSGFIRPVSSD